MVQLLSRPAYSPGLAPSDFCLFPKLKEFLRGRKFTVDEDARCMKNGWFEQQEHYYMYSTTESVLWKITGPRVFQLREIVLKINAKNLSV